MAVKIMISKNQIRAKVDKAWETALPTLGWEVLQDCNEYCKEESGALIASSYEQSNPDKGIIKWRTPYARRQYWLITAKKDYNPKASWKWAMVAKQHHKTKWAGIAKRAFKRAMDGEGSGAINHATSEPIRNDAVRAQHGI